MIDMYDDLIDTSNVHHYDDGYDSYDWEEEDPDRVAYWEKYIDNKKKRLKGLRRYYAKKRREKRQEALCELDDVIKKISKENVSQELQNLFVDSFVSLMKAHCVKTNKKLIDLYRNKLALALEENNQRR